MAGDGSHSILIEPAGPVEIEPCAAHADRVISEFSWNNAGVGYRNAMEPLVTRVLHEYLRKDPSLCRCQRCFDDVSAAALNRLKPHYVTTADGMEALERKSKQVQFAVEVVKIVKRCLDKIAEGPRHQQSPPVRMPGGDAAVLPDRPSRKRTTSTWPSQK